MAINYVKGDLLESNCDYICHQVNCQGVMGSGIAKQIREKWPEVYEEYKATYNYCKKHGLRMLGYNSYASVDNGEKYVINMAAQDDYGHDGKVYTSHAAFYDCLIEISRGVPTGSTIGFPKYIGCGLGGGDWTIVSLMIENILGKYYDVYIYEREGE